MRRALAAALLGISLWLGSLAWTGFLLTRTVLDPDRSRNVAEALYEDDAVRDRLAANIAGGVQAALPPGVPVERAELDAGARQALESPAVESVIVDAFVRTHQAMLGEGDVPSELDPGAFGAAGRDSLVQARPELDGILPASPEVTVPLPTERVPNLGPVRRGLLAAVPILALASATGSLLALVISSNRPAVVRRAGVWAIGLSAIVLLFAYGVPALAAAVTPRQSEVIAALVGAMAAETRVPAITLGVLGLAGVVLSVFWRAAPALLAEPVPPPQRRRQGRPERRRREPRLVSGPPPHRDLARPVSRPAPRPAPAARRADPVRRPDASPTMVHHRPGVPSDQTRVDGPGSRAASASGGNDDPTRHGEIVPEAPRVSGPTRWVAGLGWVVESAEEIPAEARWVPGVGYVVEDS